MTSFDLQSSSTSFQHNPCKSARSVLNSPLRRVSSISWCSWARMAADELMLSLPALDFVPDVRPITLPIWLGPALFQITNTAISLLIPAGPSFSNPSDRHEAVKHWVTSARTNNDEKWHTGAAFTAESFSSLRHFSGAVLFPSLRFTQLCCGELMNWS